MKMFELIDIIQKTKGCILRPPSKIPQIREGHVLPEDVLIFYQLCGGGVLFEESAYTFHIVSPEEFLLANPVIFVMPEEEFFPATEDEISWSWYILGEGEMGNEYITIDLAPPRLGRCYYSFWDRYAMQGYSPVIALSFTNLLIRMLETQGREWYWEKSDFISLGDAYDNW